MTNQNDQPDSQAGDELDELLDRFYLGDEERYTTEAWAKHRENAKADIRAYAERLATKARIDEQNRTGYFKYDNGDVEVRFDGETKQDDRIAALTKEKQ